MTEYDDYIQKITWFEDPVTLPDGGTLVSTPGRPATRAYKYKNGRTQTLVELWVHGGKARDEAQFLSYLKGDDHDRSKCAVRSLLTGRFFNVGEFPS